MTEVTGSQAAVAFPTLAAFLAGVPDLAPSVVEQALQAACTDYVASAEQDDVRSGWARAVDAANESISATPGQAASTVDSGWANAVAGANIGIGVIP